MRVIHTNVTEAVRRSRDAGTRLEALHNRGWYDKGAAERQGIELASNERGLVALLIVKLDTGRHCPVAELEPVEREAVPHGEG